MFVAQRSAASRVMRPVQMCIRDSSYTGYKADDDGYSIDLRCVLAAPQQ